MAALDAAGVAALLVELGRRTALASDNYFRAKAYLRAADTISALVEPLDALSPRTGFASSPELARRLPKS
jgi:DNA polymerase (family 10)